MLRPLRLLLALATASFSSIRAEPIAEFPIAENFDNKTSADLLGNGWLIGGNAIVTGDLLQLTAAVNNQIGSAIHDRPFSSSLGVNVQFDYFMGDSTEGNADGLSFFLLDGAAVSPIAGGVGHALGYAYNSGEDTPGATLGYMGVAFDRYGNFANSDSNLFHDGASAVLHPNTIAIRGPATVPNSGELNAEYDYVADSLRNYNVEGTQKVNLTVLPGGSITLRLSADGGATWTTVYNAMNFAGTTAYQGYTMPATFKLGFAASTGGQNNRHVIDNLLILKPVDHAVAFTSSPAGTQKVGDSVSYTFTVTNNGPNADSGVAVDSIVPAEITDVTWSFTTTGADGASGSDTGNTIHAVFALSVNETATFTVDGKLGATAVGKTLSQQVTTTPSPEFGDANPANDTATALTPVYGRPVITSSLTANGSYRGAFTYTITASNLPTSFAATGLPTGLTLNSATGVISGVPTQAGEFTVALTATNSGGTGDASNLNLTVAKGSLVVTAGNATRAYGATDPAFPLTYTGWLGDDTSAAMTTAPVATTTATHASAPGTYDIVPAGGVSSNYSFTYVSGTLTITKAPQTLSFNVPSLTVEETVTLNATSSSGLPVTIELVSGDATLDGNRLTAHSDRHVVLRAIQAGDTNYASATLDRTVDHISKLDQTITFPAIADRNAAEGDLTLIANASSGLPVTFTVVDGPAILDGSRLALTGAPGAVVVEAAQRGDDVYDAAAPVTRSFNVTPAGITVYFGALGSETIAGTIDAGGRSGRLIGIIPGTGEGFAATFEIAADGTWSAETTTYRGRTQLANDSVSAFGATAMDETRITRRRATASPVEIANRTFRGRLQNGVLSGTIDGIDTAFTARVQPLQGITSTMAGYYEAPSINSATGATYSVVGTEGNVYVLVITASAVVGTAGDVAPDGSFSIENARQVTIVGNVHAPSTSVTGTILLPNGEEENFSGVREPSLRTDRLINLSTRARLAGVSGAGPLITGFAIGGGAPKQVLVRAVGPALSAFGLEDAASDTKLRVFNAEGRVIAENDDWSASAELSEAMQRVGAFALEPGSKDAAVLLTLDPGSYTMHVSESGRDGVALAEIYDASANPSGEYQRLVNISSRGHVAGGDHVLIGGFIVTGNAPKRVLVRGAGPSLASHHVHAPIADPEITVIDCDSVVVARNDNWETPTPVDDVQVSATAAELIAAGAKTGAYAFPVGSRDAALIVTLQPGIYTVHLRGVGGATGTGLIEVYEVAQ